MVVHPAGGLRTGTLLNALLHHVGSTGMAVEENEATGGAGGGAAGAADGDEDGAEAPELWKEVRIPALGQEEMKEPEVLVQGTRVGIVHRLDRGTSGVMVSPAAGCALPSCPPPLRLRCPSVRCEACLG